MSPGTYTPSKSPLGQVLSRTSPPIRVPEYQRDFSWQTKHVADFWHDLISFEKQVVKSPGDGREYFLGSVVLVNEHNYHLVLDGQQRFATTTILLSVLRDRLRPLDPKAADYIQEQFIAFEDRLDPTKSRRYKLELNIFDRDFFQRVVQDEHVETNARPRRQSHKLILAARRYLEGQVDILLQSERDDIARRERLQRLASILTARFGVVLIISEDHDQAASIFETLNERGIGLSTADLLRSWVLSNTKESMRNELVRLWEEIGSSTGEQRIEGVIRTSWAASHGEVKTRALYKEIKDTLTSNRITPVDYTRTLARDAAYLRELKRGCTGTEVIDQAAKDLACAKVTSAYAALLAAHNHLNKEDASRLARALVAFAVRYSVICRQDPARFESTVYECAKAISSTHQLEPGLAVLRAAAPTNDEVRTHFKRLAFPPQRSRAAHLILRAIECGRRRTAETQIASRAKVHLEHIYPRNPRGRRVKNHDKIVYLLGNLTLLDSTLNRSASNGTFAAKRQRYAKSELLITREIAKQRRWGVKRIRERQAKLLEECLRIWPQSLI